MSEILAALLGALAAGLWAITDRVMERRRKRLAVFNATLPKSEWSAK